MKKFVKCKHSGPVPFPNSNKLLEDGDIVSGDFWEDLVALGFVEEYQEKPEEVEIEILQPDEVEDEVAVKAVAEVKTAAPEPAQPVVTKHESVVVKQEEIDWLGLPEFLSL